jgi:transposase
MAKSMTLKQFQAKFATDDICLNHLFKTRYGIVTKCPKCGQYDTFHKLAKMPAYTCNCGHHIHPMAGTPFQSTRTPLTTWFQVMYLFTSSRNGVSAKEVQRLTGVTYKTAWRMCSLIRQYMGWVDGDAPIGGSGPDAPIVEADQMFFGGRDKLGHDDKAVVFGAVERQGKAITRIANSRGTFTAEKHIDQTIEAGSHVMTDSGKIFRNLPAKGFKHETVNHDAKEYVRGIVHTNSIEAFWSHIQRSIKGTHIWVSKKHLQTYLHEFEYRHNLRNQPQLMFDVLMRSFPKA